MNKAKSKALFVSGFVLITLGLATPLVAKNPITKVKDAANIVHRSVQQVGFELEARVFYEPEDALNAIHLRDNPQESWQKRRIRLEAEPVSIWEGRAVVPDPPKEGIPVRWYLPADLLELVELRSADWDGTYPTFWNKTAGSGTATAFLYPLSDQFLGGVPKVSEFEVKAVALIQAGMGISPWDTVGVASGATEELLKPAQAVVPVRIESHVPTEWKGTAKVHREMSGFSHLTASGPKEVGDSRVTQISAASLWQMDLTLNDISLDREGRGQADYELVVRGEGDSTRIEKFKVECDDSTIKVLTDKVARIGTGYGQVVGRVSVGVKVDPIKSKYALQFSGPIGGEVFSPYYFRGEGEERHSWQTCENGEKDITNNWSLPPNSIAAGALVNLEPLDPQLWPGFDPGAMRYTNTVTYDKTFRSQDGQQRYTLVTTVTWDLQRVVE